MEAKRHLLRELSVTSLQPSLTYAELDLNKPPTTDDPSASADTSAAAATAAASSGTASDAAGDGGDTAAKGSTLEREVRFEETLR